MQARNTITLFKQTVPPNIEFAESCYIFDKTYLYKEKTHNKQPMRGGQADVLTLYNAKHEPLYAIKTFENPNHKIDFEPYRLLDLNPYIVYSKKDKLKLMYTWQVG